MGWFGREAKSSYRNLMQNSMQKGNRDFIGPQNSHSALESHVWQLLTLCD